MAASTSCVAESFIETVTAPDSTFTALEGDGGIDLQYTQHFS